MTVSSGIQTPRGRTVGRGRTYWGTPAERTRDKKLAEVSDRVRPCDRFWLSLRRKLSRCWIVMVHWRVAGTRGFVPAEPAFPPRTLHPAYAKWITNRSSGGRGTLVTGPVTAVNGGMTRRPVSQKERGGPRDRPLQPPASRQEASGATLPVRDTLIHMRIPRRIHPFHFPAGWCT